MDFSNSLATYGSAEFKDVILDDLSDNRRKLPLDDFCKAGGWPDDYAEFEINETDETANEIIVKATVYFQEIVPGACADLPWGEDRRGALIVRIDKREGNGEARADHDAEQRNLEYY